MANSQQNKLKYPQEEIPSANVWPIWRTKCPSAIFIIGDEESKTFFKFTLLDFILIIIRLLYATLICLKVEGAHWLLFLSFSLKNENNHHLMGVDKTMNLSCAGNWIKEICELLEISRYPLQVFHIPNVRRFYLNATLFQPFEWYTRERRGRKVSKRVIFIVSQSRVFPLSMCVMLTYFYISIYLMNKARLSLFLFTF